MNSIICNEFDLFLIRSGDQEDTDVLSGDQGRGEELFGYGADWSEKMHETTTRHRSPDQEHSH